MLEIPIHRRAVLCLVLAFGLLGANASSHAEIYTVDSTADGVVTSFCVTSCTLREALATANFHLGPDIIILPSGSYGISYFGDDDNGVAGDFDILEDVLILGDGYLTTTVNGASTDRVFDVQSGAKVTLRGISLLSGDSSGGGGVRNRGDLSLEEVFIGVNTSGIGGGILTEGPLSMRHTEIFDNDASRGAGLYVSGGPVLIVESKITSNTASNDGAGIFADVSAGAGYDIRIERSLISSNVAETNGGGALEIWAGAADLPIHLTIRNTTITGNVSPGQFSDPTDIKLVNFIEAEFDHVTLSTQSDLIVYTVTPVTLTLANSILDGSCGGGCASCFASAGGNVESEGNTCFLGAGDLKNVTGGSLNLLSLANNGGPTKTRALGAGSVAIGFGEAASCAAQDQRALLREDGGCDAGAYEVGATTPASIFVDDFESGDTTGWSSP